MRLTLIPHPEFSSASWSVEVALTLSGDGGLELRYILAGPIADLRLPLESAPDRADGLWQTTCFELFLRAPAGSYYEFNYAPSTQWAAYHFDDYRDGMRDARLDRPLISTRAEAGCFELCAELTLPEDVTGPIGLSAVIEEKDGTRSYWALAHPPGQPDFHHPDCFALHIPAPDPA